VTARKLVAYVGTYTGHGSDGIRIVELDEATGQISHITDSAPVPNPTFLALHPNGNLLFAALEIDNYAGGNQGALASFAVRDAGRRLELLNIVESGGIGPCHVAVDPNGRYLAAANYVSGTVSVTAIHKDGLLGEKSAIIEHRGSSVHPSRQGSPHAHSVTFTPDQEHLIAADLGTDHLHVYAFDAARGTLGQAHLVGTRPGSGPRHLAFHPNGNVCYVVKELTSEISIYEYHPDGSLRQLQRVDARAAYAEPNHDSRKEERTQRPENTGADIHVDHEGRFLYYSNRGDDTIGTFAVSPDGLHLEQREQVPTLGQTPRNFALTPDGDFLIAANQDGDTLVPFRRDRTTGRLAATGSVHVMSHPVCVLFAPVR